MNEEIKRLRAMLEGKMPIEIGSLGSIGGSERIIYKTIGDDKENGNLLS